MSNEPLSPEFTDPETPAEKRFQETRNMQQFYVQQNTLSNVSEERTSNIDSSV